MKHFSCILKTIFSMSKGVLVCILCVLFLSCTSRAALNLQEDESGSFSFSTQTGETVEATVRSLTGTEDGAHLFDETAVKISFAQAGLVLTSLSFPGSADISLSALSENLNALVPDGEQPILIETTTSGGSLTIKLNIKTMNNLLTLMPPDTVDYVDLIFPPIFTGEIMTEDEYIEEIAAMYGPALAVEIEAAMMDVDVSVPGKIIQAEIEPANVGTVQVNNKKVSFSLVLHKFLSNSDEIKIYIQWKNSE